MDCAKKLYIQAPISCGPPPKKLTTAERSTALHPPQIAGLSGSRACYKQGSLSGLHEDQKEHLSEAVTEQLSNLTAATKLDLILAPLGLRAVCREPVILPTGAEPSSTCRGF